MSTPDLNTKSASQRSSQETFFLLPEVYSAADSDSSRTERAPTKVPNDVQDRPSELKIALDEDVPNEINVGSTDDQDNSNDFPSKFEEPLTGNTLDELEAELGTQPFGFNQSPLEKADSLMDGMEEEFEAKLAKTMVRRSEYYPASSEESDAAKAHRRKKAHKAKKDRESESLMKNRVEVLEAMLAELMASSGASGAILASDAKASTPSHFSEVKVPSPIAMRAEKRVPSPIESRTEANALSPIATREEAPMPSPPPKEQESKRSPSATSPKNTDTLPAASGASTAQAEKSGSPEASPSQNKFAILPNLNPMAWLQRRDAPALESEDPHPSESPSTANLTVDASFAGDIPKAKSASPVRQVLPPRKTPSPPASNKAPRTVTAQPAPAWASSDYTGPLPENIQSTSPYLLAVFERLAGSKEDWTSDEGLVLFRPYRPLIRYEAVIRALKEHLHGMHKSSRGSQKRVPTSLNGLPGETERLNLPDMPVDDQALPDTQLLIMFIDNCLTPHITDITSEDLPEIDFADLWHLFKPGGLVVSPNEDQAYRVIEVVLHSHNSRRTATQDSFGIKCVHMDYDGRVIGPVTTFFRIPKYMGKRSIASLCVYPLRFNEDPSGLQRLLVDRGRKFMRAVSNRHMYCMGTTIDGHEQVNGQVMIDFEQAITHNPHWKPEILGIGESLHDKRVDDGCRACGAGDDILSDVSLDRELAWEYLLKQGMTAPYLRSRKMTGDTSLINDDELMLLTHRVLGFVLRTRRWATFSIEDIHEVDSMADCECFKRLVLPKGHKSMLESVVRSHFRKREGKMHSRKQSNTVRGEGTGLSILLHGAPGVGKTWTAECIAGSFGKPLFSFSCGELGTTPSEVAKQLETIFTLAQKWDCVLLLDDADMLLSERTKDDFSRDSLVSVFLRALDYYAGVLFLTTSRVSTFDSAFLSRFQLSLYYPPLDDKSSLEVWEVGIWQTRKRQRNIRIKEDEILEFAGELWHATPTAEHWNGRQIRNAFQAAIALAESEAYNDNKADRLGGWAGLPQRRESRWDGAGGSAGKGQPAVTLRRRHFELVARASTAFAQRLPSSLGTPPPPPPPPPPASAAPQQQQQAIPRDELGQPPLPAPVRDLRRNNTTGRRERANTLPDISAGRRPATQAFPPPPLPPLPNMPPPPPPPPPPQADGGHSRRPSVSRNRMTARARSSVGTSLRQEIWPAREEVESPVPELPRKEQQQQQPELPGAERWSVDPDRHLIDLTMKIPYEQLRL